MLNPQTLRFGDTGPQVEMLQMALRRAGFYPSPPDGIFGRNTLAAVQNFQRSVGLTPDGIAGPNTWRALSPWLLGYRTYTLRPGDTFYGLAMRFGSSIRSIAAANPNVDYFNLIPVQTLVIPLGFDVVPTDIRFTSLLLQYCVLGLRARYPFLQTETIGYSVMGKPLYAITMGSGSRQVFYNASHHANEWITTTVVMKFLEDYAYAYATGRTIFGYEASALFANVTLFLAPMVNPDGVDLVTENLTSGSYYQAARGYAQNYPGIPFPSGWKANIAGVDPNLQYPAGWENAREIKFAQGFTSPAPRDYVGSAPLTAPESRAVYDYTRNHNFRLTLSYHTQGEVIFWKYLDYEPQDSREIAQRFSEVSGYAAIETPSASGYAGYKDWFILEYDRPGYTIESGLGTSPLPLSQFPRIYEDNLGILTLGLTL